MCFDSSGVLSRSMRQVATIYYQEHDILTGFYKLSSCLRVLKAYLLPDINHPSSWSKWHNAFQKYTCIILLIYLETHKQYQRN